MAGKKRILIVTQEMDPYTSISEMSEIANRYSQYLQENGMEVRILMPRYGVINERRHRLHEVVRLSGMNISVDDDDYPLIIKVASLPGTRMQVYFLDNEDFFKRKHVFADENEKLFDDNLDRMVFFCKGVIETVKKFGWAPDIVHCHGWMTSLLPAYLKTHYKNEPIFQGAQLVYSAYPNQEINSAFQADFAEKAKNNNLADVAEQYIPNGDLKLNGGAAAFSDGVITAEDASFSKNGMPVLQHEEDFVEDYFKFYQNLFVTEA